MNREHIQRLLGEAAKLTKHRDYVIIGSLSVLGAVAAPPDAMVFSIDIDLYPKNDPGRTAEIASHLGLGSDFEQSNGYFADVVSPMLPTLPEGWQQRLIRIEFDNGVTGSGFWIRMTPPYPSMRALNRVTAYGSVPDSMQASFRPPSSSTACAKHQWKLTNGSGQNELSRKTAPDWQARTQAGKAGGEAKRK